ncbi:carboxymuconolactone decarboxylase family protein [Rhodanobacter sp. OK091]|uniref:carboxymuconolactone decarboxylase family protein n=1 Tax=Rhodanobacter sp. OK091 TaxID=1881037 RepID=UPI000913B95A|nr:carboxymuconolactone decarboxylase family protein [Rhodanobacter sp. OK091]SHM15319.1 Alkylhydroperoxidase family enzyme, contains CxxC motif [Rhodanobacter sp. OK091]
MRLPPILPAELTGEQRQLYEDMRRGSSAKYSSFRTVDDHGALLGPWNAWLHDPAIGAAMWGLSKALTAASRLPDNVRQILILVVGAAYAADYELYAHEAVARTKHGVSDEVLVSITAGRMPTSLNEDERLAYDLASALCQGKALSHLAYRTGQRHFGQPGLNELIYLVGYYSMLAITLNAYDVPAPEEPATQPA